MMMERRVTGRHAATTEIDACASRRCFRQNRQFLKTQRQCLEAAPREGASAGVRSVWALPGLV